MIYRKKQDEIYAGRKQKKCVSGTDPVDGDIRDNRNLPKADCVIVAVGHDKYRAMSMLQLKQLFKDDLADTERVLIDVKSLYRMDELKASGMRFWRL